MLLNLINYTLSLGVFMNRLTLRHVAFFIAIVFTLTYAIPYIATVI